MLKHLIAVSIAMLITSTAMAQIMECIDAKGKKEYASVCGAGTVKENRLSKGGSGSSNPGSAPLPASTAPAKSIAEQDAEFRKRQMEKQAADTKSAKQVADAQESQRNCASAQAQVKALQEGQRITKSDPKTGERVYVEDSDRPAEIVNAQKIADSWCNRK